MTLQHPRALATLAAVLSALFLNACSQPGEVVEACHDTPNRESNCTQYHSNWEPEWKEDKSALPALPREEDLVPIDAPNGAPGYSYAVDRATLEEGDDGVMRYTVMVKSGSGAVNVFREGIRCLTGEVRTYAYAGGGNDAFRPLGGDWGPLSARGTRGYQDYLYEAIMCDRHGYAWSKERVLESLAIQYTAGGVRIERFCGNLHDCRPTGTRF